MKKYTLKEIKKNLLSLQKKLDKKELDNGFWVIATRKDFKPLELEMIKKGKKIISKEVRPNDLKKYLIKGNEQYYIGKKLASIRFWFNNSIIEGDDFNEEGYDKIKNKTICSLIIFVYTIDNEGKFGIETLEKYSSICTINFRIVDLEKYKLKFKDAQVFMREVEQKLVTSNPILGIDYETYIKRKKEKNKK